ncbi:MAG TPA: nickel-binding protein [Gaiellaceae bacterium]|nr:nickel-binding protein [Gaiellaceae bacterium]
MEDEYAEQTGTTFLVEHYWPGVTASGFSAAAESLRSASEAIAAAGGTLRYLHSTLVPEDEAAFCVFHASSRSLVEQAYARAGVRYERILDAVEPALPSHTKGESP